MAVVNEILLPRRATKTVMSSAAKSSIVLEKGELFIEASEAIGKGHAMIKIGDGTTVYSSLGYAIGDTTNDIITFEDSPITDITTVIENIKTDSKLGELIAIIKKGISLLKTRDDNINAHIDQLTDSNKITEVVLVTSLPEDAASHPTTLYLIKSSL